MPRKRKPKRPPRQPAMSLEDRELLRTLAQQGLTYREIAGRLTGKYALPTVQSWGVRLGIRRQWSGALPIGKIKERYLAGEPSTSIAKDFGCCDTTIRNALRLYKVPIRSKSGPAPKVHILDIDYARSKGLSWAEIGRRLNMRPENLARRHRRYLAQKKAEKAARLAKLVATPAE